MASLAPTIKDKGFQNWLRGALAVLFAKQGLDDFVINELTHFQKDLLTLIFKNRSIPAGTVCNTCTTENVLHCPTQNFCSRGRKCNVHDTGMPDKAPNKQCPNNICQDIRDAIRREHRFNGPSWKNSNASKWCTDAFEIAKCFMPPDGYSSVTTLTDTDFNGTLAVIINNKRFQNKMAADLSQQNNICTDARKVGRLIRHSPDLTLSDTELSRCIDMLKVLLSDPTYLAADLKAREAVDKLKQLKANTLTIHTADITSVLDSALKDIISKHRKNALLAINTEKDEAQKKIEETTEISLKLLNDVKESLPKLETITTTGLAQIVSSKRTAIEEIKKVAEKEKKEIEETAFIKRMKFSGLANDDKQQLEESLKLDLITFYRHKCSTIPIAPLAPEHDAPLVDFYVQPPLTSIDVQKTFQEHQAKLSVHSYCELFLRSDGGLYKNIYISAKAGTGKTSFAKKLCLSWCQAHNPHENVAEKFKPEDVDMMKHFDFLFLIYLRETDFSVCQLDKMIYSQIITCLAGGHRYTDNFFKDTLRDRTCLIIVDGLDEWAHPESCRTGKENVHAIPHTLGWERCTIITTTRPWKLDTAKLSTTEIDRQVEINELNEDSSNKLVSNAINLLSQRGQPDSPKSADAFQHAMSPLKLDTIRYIPYILLQMVCLWFEGKPVGKSKCQVYSNILELTLSRGLMKLGKAYSSKVTKLFSATPGVPPSCISSNEFCNKLYGMLLDLGKLAFETLFALNRQTVLLFDRGTVLRCISEDGLDFCLKTGLLSQNKDNRHVSSRVSIYMFQHKSVQEYFAALYIFAEYESEDIKQKIRHVCHTLPAIVDMSNVFVFLGGLNPIACGEILKLLSDSDTENVTDSYRKYILIYIHPTIFQETVRSFQCLQSDIVREIDANGQSDFPLYIEDIVIEYEREESYSLLKPLIRKNLSNMKSLYIDARQSPEDFTNTVKTFDLLNVKSLRKLDIDGIPEIQDLNHLLQGSARTLSSFGLKFAVLENNEYMMRIVYIFPETVDLMLQMDQLQSLDLCGVRLTHSCMESLLNHLTDRRNMIQIVLDNISCTEHGECVGHKLDLSQHQKLTSLALRDAGVSNLCVNASSLEICNIGYRGPMPTDIYSLFTKSLENAKSLNTLSIQHSTNLLEMSVKILPKLVNLRNFFIMFTDVGDNLLTLPREMTSLEKMVFFTVKMTSAEIRWYTASVAALPQPVTTVMEACTVTPEEDFQQLKEEMKSSPKYRILFDGLNSINQTVFSFQTVGHAMLK